MINSLGASNPIRISVPVKFNTTKGEIYSTAIVDSGNTTTTGTVLSEAFAVRAGIPWTRYPVGREVGTAKKGENLRIVGSAQGLQMSIKGFKIPFRINPIIISGLSHNINLGAAFLREQKMVLNFSAQGNLRQEGSGDETVLIAVLDADRSQLDEEAEIRRVTEALRLDTSPILTEDVEVRGQVEALIRKYWKVFARPSEQYGAAKAAEFTVELKPGAVPVKQPVRLLNPADAASLKEQLHQWEEAGIIKRVKSPWSSCLVPVRRKDGGIRWAVDLRMVNAVTIGDAYPVPSIEGALEKLSGSTIFSSLDAAAAYHAVPVAESSQACLAFGTPFGTYTFLRMPFGAKNAGATYCRLVAEMIEELGSEAVLAYLDDLLIHTKDAREHLEALEAVFQIHLKFGILLRPEKTNLFQTTVSYLGHRVNEKGTQMEPNYIEKIVMWPVPKTVKELNTFLGFTGYYRNYIREYPRLTAGMNKQRKEKILKWNPQLQEDFENLKTTFTTNPLRSYPRYDLEEPFQVVTDYSSINVAGILSQVQGGEEKFIGACGRKCNDAESRYSSMQGELLAILYALEKWEDLLRY